MVPSSSWEIKPEDIVIAKHSDGSDWEIGSGGFGKVGHTQLLLSCSRGHHCASLIFKRVLIRDCKLAGDKSAMSHLNL